MEEANVVIGIHDLHLWSVAGDDASLTGHVAIADGGDAEAMRWALAELLQTRFAIHHATIQTETGPCGDEESCTGEGATRASEDNRPYLWPSTSVSK